MSDLSGKILGPYQVLLKIWETPTKAIYKAFDPQLDRAVTLEVILPSMKKPDTLMPLLREHSRILARLSHPNIPLLLDCDEYDDEICMVFDFAPKGILRRRFDQQMAWKTAASSLIPVCQSLIYAHANGVIHGNIELGNIFVNEEGTPAIFDFGVDLLIAQEVLSKAPGMWVGLGNTSFRSPEQNIGKRIDQGSDIYSLGMVFFELLTGKKAYQGDSWLEELARQYSMEVPAPRNLNTNIPEAVDLILVKALSKDPSNRFKDMQQFTSLLSKIALDIPITAQEIKVPDMIPLKSRFPWMIAGPVILFFIIVAVYGAFKGTEVYRQTGEISGSSSNASFAPTAAETIAKEIIVPQPAADPIQAPIPDPDSVSLKTPVLENLPTLAGQSLPAISEKLTPASVHKAIQLGKWGIGRVNNAAWSPDGNKVALATTLGVFVFDSQSFEIQNYLDTGSSVSGVAFSPDNNLLASGDENGLVMTWNLRAGDQQLNLTGHLGSINTVSFSPDGRLLASGSDDQTIRLWDIDTGKQVAQLTEHVREVKSIAFSRDGSRMLSGSLDGTVKVWEIPTAKIKLKVTPTSMINSVAFSANGKMFFSGGRNGVVEMWDAENGARLKGLTGFVSAVTSVSTSEDSKFISAGDYSGTIIVWDSEGKQVWKSINQRIPRIMESGFEYKNLVGFSSDSNTVHAIAWDGTIRDFKTESGEELKLIDTISDFPTQLAISPDSQFLAVETADGSVKLWNVAEGKLLYNWKGTLPIGDIFSYNSHYIAISIDSSTARVYEISTGKELRTFYGNGQINSISFHPDRNLLAVGDRNNLKVWSLTSGQEVILQRSSVSSGCTIASDYAFSSHTNLVGFLKGICDFEEIGWMKSLGYRSHYTSVVAGGDGKIEFMGSDMEGVRGLIVEKVAISEDGSLIAAAIDDYSILIWDAGSGQQIMHLYGHNRSITAMAFSLDQKYLVSSSLDGTIQIWGIH